MSHFAGQHTTHPDQPVNGCLINKIALVTGASRGIGEAIVRLFAQEGAKVVLASRNQEEMIRIVEEIKAHGGNALAIPTDVTKAQALDALVQQTLDAYGQLDIAVNNAVQVATCLSRK